MGTRSLQMSAKYLTRMYLPRLVPLVASIAPTLVEFALYGAFVGIVVGYETGFGGGFPLELGVDTLLLPLSLLLIALIATSLSLWTAVYGARGRDARWSVRAVLNVWLLLTPVIYPLSAVPAGYRTAAELNPVTAPMEMLRRALFGVGDVTALGVGVCAGFILVVGGLGLLFFGRHEANALDNL
jgi:lipopolysaccharide transport system permease protein